MPFGGGSYEIRLAGRLSDSVLSAFESEASCLTVSVEPADMVLYGPVQDQAALWGLLDRIQSSGLEVVEGSLMQLERQLRPEVYGRRRGGYLDRRRTSATDA